MILAETEKKTPLVKVYPYPRIFLFAVSCLVKYT